MKVLLCALALGAVSGQTYNQLVGHHTSDSEHYANSKSFLYAKSRTSNYLKEHNGNSSSLCSNVHCKIETHRCHYDPRTHFGTAFSNTISVCRDWQQDATCKLLANENACNGNMLCTWRGGECRDELIQGHNYESFPSAFGHSAGEDCSHLPQMWAGTNNHNKGILSDYTAHHNTYGDVANFQGNWYRAQTCQGGPTDTHYSIRVFHHNAETTCQEWGHKCGIGINTNAFKCECRPCTANEAGCVQDPSGSQLSGTNKAANGGTPVTFGTTGGVATANFAHQHIATNNHYV